MALTTLDDYVIAFQNAIGVERKRYLIRGVDKYWDTEGLKEFGKRVNWNVEELSRYAELEEFKINQKRRKHGRKPKPRITAGELQERQTYRKLQTWIPNELINSGKILIEFDKRFYKENQYTITELQKGRIKK
jgi:hypothetical protein